jgi:predicted nucleotidyltransferase/HEPN domain-containing protein
MNATADYKAQILACLQRRFEDNLLAVVLFGSRARKTEKNFSDIDILVVANESPAEYRKRRQLAASIRREAALPVDATILGPEAFIGSVRYCFPLMIEIASVHELWFEKDNFFSNHIQFIHSLMQQGNIVQLQPGVWKLPEGEDEMALAFLHEAQSDIHVAKVLLAGRVFARSVEYAQHTVQKAIKSALLLKHVGVTNEHFVAEIFEKNFPEHPAVKEIVTKAQALENESTLSEYPAWDPATDSVISPYERYNQEKAQKFYDDAHWSFHQIAVYLKHTYKISLPDS